MVNSPVVSSIRSRQTGQVGNSTREDVGGGSGFVLREVARELDSEAPGIGAVGVGLAVGVKGSFDMDGKLEGS